MSSDESAVLITRLHVQLPRPIQAAALLERALAAVFNSAAAHEVRGLLQLQQQKREDAVASFKRSIERSASRPRGPSRQLSPLVSPHHDLLYRIKFEAERDAGLIAAAERSILAAIAMRPHKVKYLLAYAWLLAEAGQLGKATRINAHARELGADNADVVWQSVQFARLRGEDDLAASEVDLIVDLKTSAPESLERFFLGNLLASMEREFKARACRSLRHE